jgi:hypothetical protein
MHTSSLLKLNLKVIAFSGKPGAGKDTAAETLYDPTKHVHLKFSNVLYDMAAVLLGMYEPDLSHRKALSDQEVKKHAVFVAGRKISVREVLQAFDTLKGPLGENLYIDALTRQLARASYERDISTAIISDLRFPAELDWLRYMGGQLIYLERSTPDVEAVLAHVSESHHELLKASADYVVENSGSREQLKADLKAALAGEALVAVR